MQKEVRCFIYFDIGLFIVEKWCCEGDGHGLAEVRAKTL